ILDGNVVRVLTRVFGIGGNPREKPVNEKLWRFAEKLVTTAAHLRLRSARRNACSHLNQSLMELGALVCTPRQPKCLVCPVRSRCIAERTGKVEELPNLGPRMMTTSRRFVAFIMEKDGRFLVRQRPAGVVNAHLW